jgi:predicted N-acyltransferase
MEHSACVDSTTGWQPNHLGIYKDNKLNALLPMYVKNHSYGEYMFDWQWANGFHRAGINYYPKAVSAIPFTPVTGPRLVQPDANQAVYDAVIKHVSELSISNFQCLYVSEQEANHWLEAGAMIRRGYQFSWYNNNYQDFDDFLARLRSAPRKKIRRERRLLEHDKLCFKRYRGQDITPELWQFFLLCYQRTYLKRSGHEGYLNKTFYDAIHDSMADDLLLIVAEYDGSPLAASLCFIAGDTLYGRYWGTLQEIDGLHFEVCYYQGIEFCIENQMHCFQPGTQGDYKRRRGFIPEYTYGAYWFNVESVRPAIEDYLLMEQRELAMQFEEWQASSPYKAD